MSEQSKEYYSLEVKVPNGSGGYTTKKVQLDYATNLVNKPLVFDNHFSFPSVGEPQFLYIATDENQIYRYDENKTIYVIIGSDWHDIDLIDCGGV